MEPTPPPVHTKPLPDYYLGMLLYYDDESDDNCRWVVYDGHSRTRCVSRKSAIDLISATVLGQAEAKTRSFLLDARMSFAHAMHQLDNAALHSEGLQRLRLSRTAVKIRPVLVEIDNILLPEVTPVAGGEQQNGT